MSIAKTTLKNIGDIGVAEPAANEVPPPLVQERAAGVSERRGSAVVLVRTERASANSNLELLLTWHAMNPSTVLQKLGANEHGLSHNLTH